MTTREALYVGINTYQHRPPLQSCEEDAKQMAKILEFDYDESYPNRPRNWTAPKAATLTSAHSKKVTEANLMGELDRIFGDATGDDVLFYFAGHADRIGKKDLLLATAEDDPKGVRAGVKITDLLHRAATSGATSVTIILDCCHAGTAANLDVSRNVTILASSDDDHQSSEIGNHGRFTACLLDGLQGGAADNVGRITALSLYSHAAELLSFRQDGQQPVVKARLDKMVVLKRVSSTVTLDELRAIPEKFSTATSLFQMTPEHEGPDGVSRTGKETYDELNDMQKEMEYFKHLRDAKLVEICPPHKDLYWACMEYGHVQLTPRGQFYWKLAFDDKA